MKKLVETLNETFNNSFEVDDISKVEIDSRNIKEGDLFLAINNGKNYIAEVLEKKASFVICDDPKWSGNKKVLVVEDTVKAMQLLAKNYRKKLKIKIVGITGSEGKTTTKDIIHGVLSSKYQTKKTLGNHNNHIGLPLTILNLQEDDEFGIIEMGMSNKGEIPVLCDIAGIDYGVITNIGDSHLEFMINRDNVFAEKSQIKNYIDSDKLFLFGDDIYLKNLKGNKIGFNLENDFIIRNYKETPNGVDFILNNQNYSFKLNGKHNCINASMGVAIGLSLGLTSSEIQKGLDLVNVTPMRFQKIEKEDIIYINDAYNASPISMEYSLNTFDKLYNNMKKIVVLGDMLELGEKEIEFHREIIEKALSIKCDKIYLYGERMKKAYDLLVKNDKIRCFNNKEDIVKLIANETEKVAVLLKGSRGMKLEEIIK